ncbi:unnamed protein product [Cladocopium goreaui]|uniref:Pentatricopeptide repeat-containing protein At5g02860 n=1 Tax=Cladocopium goreaui TaxID=2562237 RepID=A0A9P1C9J8_9DINO|nr:unnamed protein product [Cladocopium goreaui]
MALRGRLRGRLHGHLRSLRVAAWQRSLDALSHGKDLVEHTRALQSMGKAKRWDLSLALLQHLQDDLVQVDGVFCTSLINSCRRGTAWTVALQLLAQLEATSLGVRVSVHHYGAVASTLETARRWQEALQLIGSCRDPNQEFLGAIISACEKSSRWEACMYLLNSMAAQHGVTPDVIAFNAAMVSCGRGLRWRDALELTRQLRCSHLAPSVVTYSSVMSALERSRQWELTISLFEEMQKCQVHADAITWNSLVSACESGEQWGRALYFLSCAEMEVSSTNNGWRQGLKPGFNSLISACAKAGRWEMALHLLTDSDSDGLDLICYNSVLLHLHASKWRLALGLQERAKSMELPDDPTQDLTMNRALSMAFQNAGSYPHFSICILSSLQLLWRQLRPPRFRAPRGGEFFVEAAMAASRLRGLALLGSPVGPALERILETSGLQSLERQTRVRPRREVSWRLSERALEVLSSVGAGFLRTALDQTQLRWRKWGGEHMAGAGWG